MSISPHVHRVLVPLVVATLGLSSISAAQGPTTATRADTARLRRTSRALAFAPHMAGDRAQVATADYVLTEFAALGLDTSRTAFRAYLPHPRRSIVTRLEPSPGEVL